MTLLGKWLGRSRVRRARQELANQASPMNYSQLAYEYACQGNTREALRVCEEGLNVFPGSSELARMKERVRRLDRESRLRELKRELQEAPRPALWAEMCEILIEGGQISRAEDCAREWHEKTQDPEAVLMRCRTRVERFLADRGREAGKSAFAALDEIQSLMARDPRPWHLRLQLAWRIGAWKEARRAAAKLLELQPGDPVLEARFRTLDAFSDSSPSIEQALINVEKTGRLVDDKSPRETGGVGGTNVRNVLRDLAAQSDIHAAMYVRGGTALVQGVKGATAERAARSVRKVLQSGRGAARRLGLGQLSEFILEGDFGALTIAPGELDAGALWSSGPISRANLETIMNLAGVDAATGEVVA